MLSLLPSRKWLLELLKELFPRQYFHY